MRDGSEVEDVRLGRLRTRHPEKNRPYQLAERLEREELDTKPLRSYSWLPSLTLDQNGHGACVSFTLGYDLDTRPVKVGGVTNELCLDRYYKIQDRDEWPGSARPGDSPSYEGTSMRAGADQLVAEGHYLRYDWADPHDPVRALRQTQLGVGYRGPMPLGIVWRSGMMRPDEDGFIRPTGHVVGGHSILQVAVSLKRGAFGLKQSWGPGSERVWWLSFHDWLTLYEEDGETYSPTRRRLSRVGES